MQFLMFASKDSSYNMNFQDLWNLKPKAEKTQEVSKTHYMVYDLSSR